MPIRLEIYLDKELKAEGQLYLDDGETFRYKTHNESSLLQYKYINHSLSYTILTQSHHYDMASEIKLTEVYIFGLPTTATKVDLLYR